MAVTINISSQCDCRSIFTRAQALGIELYAQDHHITAAFVVVLIRAACLVIARRHRMSIIGVSVAGTCGVSGWRYSRSEFCGYDSMCLESGRHNVLMQGWFCRTVIDPSAGHTHTHLIAQIAQKEGAYDAVL